MKRLCKRMPILFFLLVLTLSLPVLAAGDEPLYFRSYSFEPDGLTLSETVQTAVEIPVGQSCWGVFYTGADATPETQIPASAISSTDGFGVYPWGNGGLPQDMMEIAAGIHVEGNVAGGTFSYRNGTTTYSIPVSISLPKAAFYKTKERTLESLWQKALPYGTDGDGAPLSAYFLVPEGCTITKLEENLSFLEVTLSADNTYATVTVINDDFVAGQQYCFVYELSDGTSTDIWFYVEDRSPRLMCSYTYRNDTFFSTLSGQIGMGESYRVYYVSGYEETPIPLSYLKLPTSVLSAEMLDDPYSFWINFHGATDPDQDEAICYELDGTTLRLPVEVSLPTVGFYSAPTRSAETVLSDALIGPIGEMATCYVIWDPAVISNATNIVFLEGKEGDVQTTVSLTEETIINKGDIVITPEFSEHRLRLDIKIGNKQRFGVSVNDYSSTIFACSGPSYVWGLGNHGAVIYQGESYTVDFASLNHENALYLHKPGTYFTEEGEDLDQTLFVGAIRDYDTARATEAAPGFYDCIKSLSVTVTDCYKLDGMPAPAAYCTVTDAEAYRFHGCETTAVHLQAKNGNYCIACLNATLVFQEPGKPEQTVTFSGVYVYNENTLSPWYTLKMDDALSEEAVNGILASNDALAAWLEEEHGETWGYLKAAGLLASDVPFYDDPYIKIVLPAKTFDDIIHVGIDRPAFNETYHVSFYYLVGATNEEGELLTTMPSMEITGRVMVQNIAFRADPKLTMTYGEETFTCGILASGDGVAKRLYSNITGCTFDDFDYGIRATPTGCISSRAQNVFRNCGVGYLLDCTGYEAPLDGINECDFIGCGTAFRLVALPKGEAPYYYRVVDCNFVGNGIDVDVSQEARFYFHRNFYGGLRDPEVLSAAEKDVYYRTARIKDHDTAMVITNPRAFWINGIRGYVIDPTPGLLTWIINQNADVLTSDSAQLERNMQDAEEPLTVTVVDDNDEELGVWTIDNGAQTQSLSLLSGESTAFNAGLTFGEDDEGNRTVTVKDSSLFAGRQTVLTVPCTFARAKVLFEGAEVPSTTADGTVTFSVAAGGVYTIEEHPVVVHRELQGSGLLFRDRGEGSYAEATLQGDVVTVSAAYQSVLGSKGTLMLAVYDSVGRMVALTQQAVEDVSAGETSVAVDVDASALGGADSFQVKAFFLAADSSLAPQSPVLFEAMVQTVTLP